MFFRLYISTVFEQQAPNFRRPVVRGTVQRGPTVHIRQIYICAML